MNKKTVLACLLACSTLMLTQCITKGGNSSGNTDDKSSHSGEGDEVQLIVETGKTFSQDGQLSFAADSQSKEGEVVHVAYNEETRKTTVYGLDAGEAKLTDGEKNYNVTVNYGLYKGTGEISVALGDDYRNLTNLASVFRGNKTNPYLVGNKNPFRVDAGLRYKTFTLEDGEWGIDEKVAEFSKLNAAHIYDADNVKIEVTGGESGTTSYATINNDLTVSFTEAAAGQTLTVQIWANGQKVEQTVKVNNGYNAYDSDSFRALYEDPSIHGDINILRSFKAEVEDYQLYTSHGQTYLYNTVSSDWAQKYQGSVYYRVDHATTDSPLTINGNYMVLDATEVPQHYNGDGSELDEAVPVGWRDPNPFDFTEMKSTQSDLIQGKVCNAQEGIFRLWSNSAVKTITFNDWNIRGNSNTGSEDNPTLESTGEIGVIVQSYNFNANNCIFDLSVYGAACYDARGTAKYKDCIIQNTWGSSVTTWRGPRVEVINTLCQNAGSAAFWLINNGNVEDHKGNLIIDADSVINNYLSTSSAWFVAYGLTDLNVFAQSIEEIINVAATGHPHTMYKSTTDKTFNFEVLVQTESDNDTAYPFANVNFNGAISACDPTCYGKAGYVESAADPKAYVKGIYDAKNSIVKCIGQSDVELGTAIYSLTQAPYNLPVANAYAFALANALAAQEALGNTAHIQVDTAMQGGLSAIIAVKPAA